MPVLSFLFADLTPASAVLLAASLHAAASVPYFLLVDADRSDFRPQALASLPVPRLLLDTDAGARLTVAVFNAKQSARDFYRDAAALLILLTTSPKGALL